MSLLDSFLLDPPKLDVWIALRTDARAQRAIPLTCRPTRSRQSRLRVSLGPVERRP
jgi:hypothetical protein